MIDSTSPDLSPSIKVSDECAPGAPEKAAWDEPKLTRMDISMFQTNIQGSMDANGVS